jgi:hypothetical protein
MMRSLLPFTFTVLALLAVRQAHAAHPSSPTLFLIGDSTVTNQALVPAQPLRGWGQMLPLYLKHGIRVENHASSGGSAPRSRPHEGGRGQAPTPPR